MKRVLLFLPAALALSSCAALPALLGGIAPAPATISNKTTLDEKGSIGLETLYTTFAYLGAVAYRSGVVKPSTNPAVQRDDFCERIIKRQITPADKGMELAAVECKLRLARDAARSAYDAANQNKYDAAFADGIAAYDQGMALIRSN